MDTSTYIAKTWIPKGQSPMRDMEVDGSTSFQIPTSEFVISPLNAPASLYVLSIREGIENPKPIVQLNANEYTQISGLVPNITLYVGTNEKFYIRF